MEREVDVIKERLDAAQRAASAGRSELDMREERLNRKEREFRSTMHDIQTTRTQISLFREQLASILSDVDDSVLDWSEEAIRNRIASLKSRNLEMVSVSILSLYVSDGLPYNFLWYLRIFGDSKSMHNAYS